MSRMWSYRLQTQLGQDGRLVEALLEEAARYDPTLTPERLLDLGQMFFARLALEQQDTKAWVLVQRLDLEREQFEFDQAKFKETLRSKLQAGLDVLAHAFKCNPEAMELYQEARVLITQETR